MTLAAGLRIAALVSILPLLGAGSATAQETPDVPTGNATIRGQVRHAQTGAPIADAEVALYALPADAPPGLRRTNSDANGDFAFESIGSDPRTTYLVGARHQGVPYPGARVQFVAGETERSVEVLVADVTSDGTAATLAEIRIRIDWLGGRLLISETLVHENSGAQTIVVPDESRTSSPPLTRLELPEGAGTLSGPLGVVPEGLVRDGREVAWWGPLLPGRHELEYAYEIPTSAATAALDRTLPAGVRVIVLAPQGGPEFSAPDLESGESLSVLGRSYTQWQGETRADPLALTLRLPEARLAPGAVELAEVRIIGELDEAAWSGREEHVLSVSGAGPVVGAEGSPLWVVPLPAEARDVRFGVRESSATLVPSGDGGLAILGPLSAGETTVDISYRLAADEPFVLARQFSGHLPLLSIYLAETGRLDLASDRLHRRRSVRTSDRSYIHLEAFEIEAGERVALEVRPLARRTRLPGRASLLLMSAIAGIAIFFLVGPLRGPAGDEASDAPEAGGARRERDSLYAALADLEHDHETGKVDDTDYATMRADLRGRALELLAGERREAAPSPEAPELEAAAPSPEAPELEAAAPSPEAPELEGTDPMPESPPGKARDQFCRACGVGVKSGDRFCGQCGKPLGTEAPA